MKIQYALMSCNVDSDYAKLWPTVAAAWLKLGITPVCICIIDNSSSTLPKGPQGSIVHTVPLLANVHIMPQVLMLRFWASYLYQDAVVVTSDMDFIPLSNHFFHTQLAPYPNHAYLHLHPFPTPYPFTHMFNIPEKLTHLNKVRYLQSWFHVAEGRTMHRVLKLSPDWETTCKKTVPYHLHKEARITIGRYTWKLHAHGKEVPWGGDEIYTSIQLHHASQGAIYYISYQLAQYSGIIWDTIPLINTSINTQRERFIGIHYQQSPSPEVREVLEHLSTYGKAPKLRMIPRYYIAFWYWLMHWIDILKHKNKPIGLWIFLWLILIIWCMLRILPASKPYNEILLNVLWNKRTALLGQHPRMMQLFKRLLRIKSTFSPK